MSIEEYSVLTPGELMDLISCYQIAHGTADQEEEFIPDYE